MGKDSLAHITNKKIAGNKVMYQLQRGQKSEWMEYSDLTDYLDQIMQYQNQRKNSKLPKKLRKELTHKEDLMLDESLQAEGKYEESKTISDLLFIEKRENCLKFKVFFTDGSFSFMNNHQIRKANSDILLDFYEKYIIVGFQ